MIVYFLIGLACFVVSAFFMFKFIYRAVFDWKKVSCLKATAVITLAGVATYLAFAIVFFINCQDGCKEYSLFGLGLPMIFAPGAILMFYTMLPLEFTIFGGIAGIFAGVITAILKTSVMVPVKK